MYRWILFVIFSLKSSDNNILSLPLEISFKIIGTCDQVAVDKVMAKQFLFYKDAFYDRSAKQRKKVDYCETKAAFIPAFNLLLTCKKFYNNNIFRNELFFILKNQLKISEGMCFFLMHPILQDQIVNWNSQKRRFSLIFEEKLIKQRFNYSKPFVILKEYQDQNNLSGLIIPFHIPELLILELKDNLTSSKFCFNCFVIHFNNIIEYTDFSLYSFVCLGKTLAHGILLLCKIFIPHIHISFLFTYKNLKRIFETIQKFDQKKIKPVAREDVFYKDHLLWSYLFPEQAFAKKVYINRLSKGIALSGLIKEI